MKDKSRTILRVLFFCALSFVVVVALFFGVLWLEMNHDDRLARVEIQKRLDEIRAAGQPLTAQDLAKLYPDPPPKHDAVLLLKPALAAMAIPEDSTNIPFFGDYWPTGTAPIEKSALDEIQTCLDKNQRTFDSIPWEKLQDAWIGSSFTNGLTNLVDAPVSKINALVKLLCLNAVFQAELGHPKEAVQFLQKAIAIGNTWRNDIPIHGLVKLAAKNWLFLAMERILNKTPMADSDLMSISDSLASTNVETAKDYVVQERCIGLFHANQLQSLAKQAKEPYEARIIYRDQDLLNYLEWDEHCLAAMDLPLSNAVPTLHNMERDSDNLVKKQKSLLNKYLNTFKKKRFSFMSVLEPRMSGIVLSEAGTIAEIHVAQTALAVEIWRLAHDNNLPDSLAELVPDFLPSIPIDPFDGQPLRYKKLARGYVVYSVGPDFTDDGGKKKPADAKDSDHYDITFTVGL